MGTVGLGTLVGQARALLKHAMRPSDAPPQLSFTAQFLVVVACVGLATAARWAIELFVSGVVPFATYFPAIAIAAIVGGFRTGLAAWLLSIVLGLTLFIQRDDLPGLTVAEATSATLFAASAAVELLIASWLRDLFWESRRNESRYRALVESSASLTSTFDPTGACQEPQPGWEALTGMPWPTYQGFAWLDRVHEDDRAKLKVSETSASTAEVRVRDAAGLWRWFVVNSVPVLDVDGRVVEHVASLAEVTEHKETQERRELLLNDMRHRLKNFIAVIQALVTAAKPKDNPAIDAFADTFLKRVRTLQGAGDLVMQANAQDVDLAEVVPAALAPFIADTESRISIDGPSLLLKEHTVGAVALACHELATNSAKYGALSIPTGNVAIGWSKHTGPHEERVTIEWIERNGPLVVKPTRQGFGTRIITSAMSREPNGEVQMDYLPTGLHCRMMFVKPPSLPANTGTAAS